MAKPLHLIYILGIGDQRGGRQQKAVNTWHWWGVEAEVHRLGWSDGKPWPPKFKKLLARVDELTKDGKDLALVGASAGGAAAINAFAARKDSIVGVVLIAGKVNSPQLISPRYRNRNPAFVEAVENSAKAIATLSPADRQRILSRYGLYDPIVPKRDSIIPGARNRVTPSIGHVFTIASQITLGAPGFVRFLKKLQSSK